MKVTKHHYAIELAKVGSHVFYIEPPDNNLKRSFSIKKYHEYDSLYVVSYRPIARGKRFFPSYIFQWLLKFQIKKIVNNINMYPDVVICFDPYRFENLKDFNAIVSIFFAADLFEEERPPKEAKTADLCLGVSPSIVDRLKRINPHSFFINHGLNAEFVDFAKQRLAESISARPNPNCLKAGYFGNLMMETIDRVIVRKIIEDNLGIKFYFWGTYEKHQDTIAYYDDPEVYEFINFLKNASNVVLMGVRTQRQLIDEIDEIDFFWHCYKSSTDSLWDGSNSHKILEYLSTGKPVICHFVSTYKNKELLYMNTDTNNTFFPDFFKSIIKTITEGEDTKFIKDRIEFAVYNSYANHVKSIEYMINSIV